MGLLVNGELVDETAIRQESELIRCRLSEEAPEETGLAIQTKAHEWAQDNAIERILLRQAALEYTARECTETRPLTMGESGSPTQEGLPDWRVTKLLESITRDVPRPQRREVVEFYRKNDTLFLTPECAHASHIVKNVDERTTEADARRAIEIAETELRSGRPFAEVADEHSDCPGDGGELGWFPRGRMVEEFDAIVFALRPAQVSGIFRSPFGFHLAKLHQRKAAGVSPLPEVYKRVEEMIMNRRREEAVERFLDDLRAKAEIRRVPSAKPDAIE